MTNEGKAVQRLGISKEQRLVIEIRLAYVQQKVPACMYRRYYLPRQRMPERSRPDFRQSQGDWTLHTKRGEEQQLISKS